MLCAILIFTVGVAPSVSAWFYFRRQKAICQKYPFFRLRDKVIREIISSNNPKSFIEDYEMVNYVVAEVKLSRFGIGFFTDIMAEKISLLIERHYQLAIKSPMHKVEGLKGTKFQMELARLILNAAFKRSFILNLVTTRIGARILLFPILIQTGYKIVKRHPHLIPEVIERYIKSVLKYAISCHKLLKPPRFSLSGTVYPQSPKVDP